MSKKYDNFLIELIALCVKHGISIYPSYYDFICIADRNVESDKECDLVLNLKDCTKDDV
jgi:hypothetical protein